MLEGLNNNLVVIASIVTSIIVISGGCRIAWTRVIGPMVHELREFIHKAILVFDVVLSTYKVVESDGKEVELALPQLLIRLITWQIRHDERYPEDAEPQIQSTPSS